MPDNQLVDSMVGIDPAVASSLVAEGEGLSSGAEAVVMSLVEVAAVTQALAGEALS
jgi:hypothetical protein